jgi:predicted P-loop ATPase
MGGIMEVNSFLNLLSNVKKSGTGHTARCPSHDDHENSLSIAHQNDKILLNCFAGCRPEEIVSSLGLCMADLFHEEESRSGISLSELSEDKGIPEEFLLSLGITESESSVFIPYRKINGDKATRHRIRTHLSARKGSIWTKGKGETLPYGLWRLQDAKNAEYLTIVEGESDCWTLWFNNFPAIGMPGANTAKKLKPEYLHDIPKVYIIQENDHAGAEFSKGISKKLSSIGYEGSYYIVKMESAKDPNDLYKKSPQEFKNIFQSLLGQSEQSNNHQDSIESSVLYGPIRQEILSTALLQDGAEKSSKTKSLILQLSSLSPLDQDMGIQWMSQIGLGGKAALGAQLRSVKPNGHSSSNKKPLVKTFPDDSPYCWRNKMIRNKEGNPTENMSNYMLLLANHEKWHGRFWWDEVKGISMIDEEVISDHIIADIALWMGSEEKISVRSPGLLEKSIHAVCQDKTRDLIREWIETLPDWDGIFRMDKWPVYALGSAPTPLTRFIGMIIPVSMIARGLNPGIISRYVVILEGPEASGKTRFVRSLGMNWYSDLSIKLDSKEARMILRGTWVVELSELDSLSKSEESKIKAFITDVVDRYVPKYSNNTVSHPRRSIFVGTTNEPEYLRGLTGNTRFIPLVTGRKIDIDIFEGNRKQIFAEALCYYNDHKFGWWEIPKEVLEELEPKRNDRRFFNPYEESLEEWLESREEVYWVDIAEFFLQLKSPEQWKDKSMQMQIAQALRACGWERKSVWREGKTKRAWVRQSKT